MQCEHTSSGEIFRVSKASAAGIDYEQNILLQTKNFPFRVEICLQRLAATKDELSQQRLAVEGRIYAIRFVFVAKGDTLRQLRSFPFPVASQASLLAEALLVLIAVALVWRIQQLNTRCVSDADPGIFFYLSLKLCCSLLQPFRLAL